MEDTKTITLRRPVAIGEISYEKLELREPNAGELERAADASTSTGVVINLISIVAKVPRKAVEGICQRDFQDATDFFGQFSAFSAGPSGETSSQT